MMIVPRGCFTIGTSSGEEDEKNGNRICFDSAFLIDKTEVTQAQFKQFEGSAAKSPNFAGDDRPVESISWFEAREFCARRGARLPTEAEWEYAARGPDGLTYPWGNTFAGDNVVYDKNSFDETAPVGSKPGGASWVGALDMSGNVYEWTSTLYRAYPYVAGDGREDPSDTARSRVLRGGSWGGRQISYLRTTYRGGNAPDGASFNYGVRCVRALE
jgi:iron(II)-dependent oxidoreductase